MEDNLKILVCGGCYKPVTNVDIGRCDGCGLAVNYRTEYLASKAKQLYEYYQAEDNMRVGRTIYTVISGLISNLQTQAIHAQYLKNIKPQQQTASAVAITQAALGDAGAVFSAQAATDEGDPVEGFVMLVADKVVSGNFWKTTFQNGDDVHAIGYEYRGIFQAIAVAKPSERTIWMMPHCERGTISKRKHLFKIIFYFILFAYFCAILLSIFSNMPAWANFTIISISLPVFLIVTVGMSWGDFMSFAREMNAVGTALGLPDPEKIDLFKSTSLARKEGKPDLPMGVYYY